MLGREMNVPTARRSLGDVRSHASRLGQVAGLLLLCSTIGCTSVKPDDLVGSWSMTESSRRYLPSEVSRVAPRLTLNSGGTFSAVEYPRSGLRETWTAFSGRGTWTFQRPAGSEDVYLAFDDDFGNQLWISNFPGSPTTLYFSVGDPDSGRRIQFTRAP